MKITTTLILIFIATLTAPAFSQTPVGGCFETLELSTHGNTSFPPEASDHMCDVFDLDGDGLRDILVGEDTASSGIAAVSAYSGVSGAKIFTIVDPTGLPVGWTAFGHSIADLGDLNGDNIGDFAVSDWFFENSASVSVGRVFVYSGATQSLMYQFEGPSNSWKNNTSNFSRVMANIGDVDLDGKDDLFVGAPQFSSNPNDWAGYFEIRSGSTGALLHSVLGSKHFGHLGQGVCKAGDTNGDGVMDYAVLEPDILGSTGGIVHLYDGASHTELAVFHASSIPGGGNTLGRHIYYSPDLLGPGLSTPYPGIVMLTEDGAWSTSLLGLRSQTMTISMNATLPFYLNPWESNIACLGDYDADGVSEYAVVNGAEVQVLQVPSTPAGVTERTFDAGTDWASRLVACNTDSGDVSGQFLASIPDTTNNTNPVSKVRLSSCLSASSNVVSASSGGTIDYNIDFPDYEANLQYRLCLSGALGDLAYGDAHVPLAYDNFLTWGLSPAADNFFTNMSGVLDASGDALVQANIPAGFLSNFVGINIFFAAVSRESNTGSEASLPVRLRIQP